MVDWALALPALGVGALHGLNTHKQEQKEKEQQAYDRNRQATADQQTTELHKQKTQLNDQSIQGGLAELDEYKRVQGLNNNIAQYNQFKSLGDIDGAARLYTDTANQLNANNPNWNPDHILAYETNPTTKTSTIWVRDKNTNQNVRLVNDALGVDDFIQTTYGQIKPAESYASQQQAKAEAAKAQQERQWKLEDKDYDFRKDLTLTGVKGQQARDLALLNGQIGAERDYNNYQYGVGRDNNSSQNRINESFYKQGSTTSSSKTVSATQSNLQGALSFVENNSQLFGFLNGNPELGTKTIAMMAIESGGNPNAFSGSSHGLMQLHGKYATGFAKQFGVQGDPIKDPAVNVRTGAALINHLNSKYSGNTDLIAAAYNAGEPAIDNALKSWEKSGKKGTWFDHLNVNQDAKQQVAGHIEKYNLALGMLSGQDYTKDYKQGVSSAASNGVQAVTDRIVKETQVGSDKASIAGVHSALAQAQNDIVRFASANTTEERGKYFNNVANTIIQTLRNTPFGASATQNDLKNYAYELTAQAVGAKNLVEAGTFINAPKKQAAAKAPKATIDDATADDYLNSATETLNPFIDNDSKKVDPKNTLVVKPEYANRSKVMMNAPPSTGLVSKLGRNTQANNGYVPPRLAELYKIPK